MAHYKIGLVQRVIEESSIEVEADSSEEAVQKVMELAGNGDLKWNFLEVDSDPEVVSIVYPG